MAKLAWASFCRFFGVLCTAMISAGLLIYLVELKASAQDYKLAMSVLLGIPLFLASTLWRESHGWTGTRARVAELLGGATFLLLHYLCTQNDLTDNYALRYFQVSLALHLLVAFSAFLGARRRGRSEIGFWQLNKTIFLRLLHSGLYAGVFFVGLSVAMIAVSKLFSLDIDSERFLELFILSSLVLQSWHFAAGLPLDLKALDEDHSYPRSLRIFVQYLLIPLVSLYMVILYCYMAKILVTQVWPRGSVGWLVSIMSVLGIFNLLLIDPEKEKPDRGWIRTYQRLYYILILPLLAMLFIAVGKRVSEYGVTEPRYALVVLGIYLVAVAAYFLWSREKKIRLIPMSLCALALATSFGPWSMYSVSRASQRAVAREILERDGLLAGDLVQADQGKTSVADIDRLESIFKYLISHHGTESLQPWFKDASSWDSIKRDLGLVDRERRLPPAENFYFRTDLATQSYDVQGYELMFVLDPSNKHRKTEWRGRKIEVTLLESSAEIAVTTNGRTLAQIPLASMIAKLGDARLDSFANSPDALFRIVGTGEGVRVLIQTQLIEGTVLPDGKYQITNFRGLVFLR